MNSLFFRPLLSRNMLLISLILALVYFLVQVILFNQATLMQTLGTDFPVKYKLDLIFNLIIGYLSMFSLLQQMMVIATSLLVGLNVTLVIALIQRVKEAGGRVKMSIGGSGVLALVSTGCPSCSVSLFSIFGSTSGLASFMLHYWLFQAGILALLGLSTFLSLRSLQTVRCAVNAPGRLSKPTQ